MRTFLIIFILLITFSCGKNEVEKTDEAISVALTLLDLNKCDDAIDVLSEAGHQNNNGVYLQVLASAYACKAGFEEISFITANVTNIVTTNPEDILKSFASFSFSAESVTDSGHFTAIKNGINVLLNSTSGPPSQTARTSKFGPRRAGDMGVQALLLNLANLGKFLRYYGDTNASGEKSAGPGSNKCFLDYNDTGAQTLIAASQTGACDSITAGHPDLDQTTVAGRRRICEGLMLLTNSINILENIDFSSSSTLSVLQDVATQVGSFRTAAQAASLDDVINMTSQSVCETYAGNATNLLKIEYFYALVFEKGLL